VQPQPSKNEVDSHVDGGSGPGAITERLARLRPGEPAAWNDLVALVYGDLHRLARRFMRDQVSGATLQPTALVNETYLRLLRQTAVEWKGRAHFFGVAALLMRRILVDEARRRAISVRVMEQAGRTLGPSEPNIDLCLLDSALTRLAQLDARQAGVVELRYFGGLTINETASFLGVSPKTVKRDWEMARAWLRAELRGSAA
jgi:RNA polymerase sigma-70 factor, ECF subfamily